MTLKSKEQNPFVYITYLTLNNLILSVFYASLVFVVPLFQMSNSLNSYDILETCKTCLVCPRMLANPSISKNLLKLYNEPFYI